MKPEEIVVGASYSCRLEGDKFVRVKVVAKHDSKGWWVIPKGTDKRAHVLLSAQFRELAQKAPAAIDRPVEKPAKPEKAKKAPKTKKGKAAAEKVEDQDSAAPAPVEAPPADPKKPLAAEDAILPMLKPFKSIKNVFDQAVILIRADAYYYAIRKDAEILRDVCGITPGAVKTPKWETAISAVPEQTIEATEAKLISAGYKVGVFESLQAAQQKARSSYDLAEEKNLDPNICAGKKGCKGDVAINYIGKPLCQACWDAQSSSSEPPAPARAPKEPKPEKTSKKAKDAAKEVSKPEPKKAKAPKAERAAKKAPEATAKPSKTEKKKSKSTGKPKGENSMTSLDAAHDALRRGRKQMTAAEIVKSCIAAKTFIPRTRETAETNIAYRINKAIGEKDKRFAAHDDGKFSAK